jgi:hypothetical protein
MLTDEMLMNDYMKCVSVKLKTEQLNNILSKYIDNNEISQNIINEYTMQLIPAGTKGVVRGNKFNHIVKRYITELNLDLTTYEVCFEKKCDICVTDEIPDWYIRNIETNKLIIGMNQLDFLSGGQQINRGYKYLFNEMHNSSNVKLLCVICNDIQFKNEKNKAYTLYKHGFINNTLCYLNGLKNIIYSHFNLSS